MNDSIAALVRDMKNGDEGAFDQLYRLYAKKLYGMAFLISKSRADSEDIVQEAFVKCFLWRSSIREEKAFESWLYQILVRTAWRFVKQKRSDFSYEELSDSSSENYSGSWIQLDKETLEPLEEMISREEKETLIRAVGNLELKQRTVVTLYYFNRLSVKDIARITGSFEGTVKSRLHKGRENLKRQLEAYQEGRRQGNEQTEGITG